MRAPAGTPASHGYSFPPEWARHRGTWISWPRPEGISFPDRYHQCIEGVIGVIAAIARFEEVHLNVPNGNYRRIVKQALAARAVPFRRVRLHEIPTNECWTRDHGPAFVLRTSRGRVQAAVVDWSFNAWGGKYPPYDADDAVPTLPGRAVAAAGVDDGVDDGVDSGAIPGAPTRERTRETSGSAG